MPSGFIHRVQAAYIKGMMPGRGGRLILVLTMTLERRQLLDLGLAIGLAAGMLVEGPLVPASIVCVLLVALPLAGRRRWPLVVFGVVVLGVLVTSGTAPWFRLLALIVAAYSLGEFGGSVPLALVTMLVPATLALIIFSGQLPAPPEFAGPYLLLGVPWLVGNAIRQQQRRAEAFRERAQRLELEQAQATQAALAAERARIARELHDIVAHNVSVMVIQAGAARQVLAGSPEQARQALLAAESSGREALAELRHLLGLLSAEAAEAGDAALAPQPGLAQLESLVARVVEAGLPVECCVEGAARPLSPGLDLAAYRILQEALTNALKYAGRARTQIVLTYQANGLRIEVLDDGVLSPAPPAPPTQPTQPTQPAEAATLGRGRGLVGMRERALLYGGSLEAGPREGQPGYAVRAWLPFAPTQP